MAYKFGVVLYVNWHLIIVRDANINRSVMGTQWSTAKTIIFMSVEMLEMLLTLPALDTGKASNSLTTEVL